MSEVGILRRVARALWTPHFVAFAIIATPIMVLSYQVRPGNHDDLVEDLKKRYGYQYQQEMHARNSKLMESVFENRHKSIGDFTPGFKHSQPEDKK